MPKRHNDLYGQIANFSALRAAYKRAVAGKRKKPSASRFAANLEGELLRLERELLGRSYSPGQYVKIAIKDPKERTVSAAPFRDRVVHHALCAVVQPLFENGFIDNSYANRTGKGSHRAIGVYERYSGRFEHVLRCDIFRFFPAIDHEILKSDLRRRISCKQTLWLMDTIVNCSNEQEPVSLHFTGDTLFSPYDRRRGLPIGNLTSQFFANLYLDGFDHFVTEVLHAPYVRYVDDFALFDDDPVRLSEWTSCIAEYFEGRRLKLHPRKTVIQSCLMRATFLGFSLVPDGPKRLPEANVRRFRNRLRGLKDQWRVRSASQGKITQHVHAWVAHAGHAKTWRLRHAIFKRGWFDPASPSKPERPPSAFRVVRGGSWNNNPRNCRSATRNRNAPDNRNNNIGFRLASTLNRQSFQDHGPEGRANRRSGSFMMTSPVKPGIGEACALAHIWGAAIASPLEL